ncbi:MAG: amino acid adenylation domain-containing protein [Nostoc sp.]|uniref:non-ribosomal peptide synthetase n=1 Tax=Nostoc sp. TaxID=1180 RepID=UPI002FF89D70
MKPIEEFLLYLDDLDIKLWIDEVNGSPARDVRLLCNAPKGTLIPDIRAELAERKDEIIAFLQKTSLASTFTLELIQPISRNGTIPLSLNQQRLWFIHQIDGESTTYNEFFTVSIKGLLQISHLEQSLQEIIQRHEILRTTFPHQDGYPIQAIAPTLTITLPVMDLQALPKVEQSTLIQQLSKEVQRPFDLVNGPLLRVTLVQLEKESYVLLLCMHHIVYDGWSMGVFIQELSTLYQAFCAGVPSPLPKLPIQYADFAVWQRQWLSKEILKTQLNYWQQQLHGAPSRLQLPTDRTRPSVQTYQGRTESFTLNRDLTQKLQTLSQQSGTTLFMTLLAAFSTLLYRYSGQSDILIGSPIANRNRSEIESLIGFFVNTLVLRTRFEDNPSFEKLLTQVRQTTLKAYEHQDVPFEQVVEALQPQRSLSHSPLFQVMFVLQNTPMSELELPGCTWYELNQESTIARFDLTLSITETDRGLVGEWEYNTDLFDGSTIERMAAHFQNLCSAIVENPVATVGELPLLSEAERHQLLVEWNDTASVYPTDKCIHQLFEEQVERTPLAVAVVFENQQLTYQQLNQRANQLAHHLQTLGVGPEVLVGICVERSIEMVVGLLGILKAGGAYVPLDPNYPQERLSYMLADSQLPILLTQQHLLKQLPEHQTQIISLDEDWQNFADYSQDNPCTQVKSDNLAYIIYTSGSTGKPKGTMILHSGMVNYLSWCTKAYNVADGEGSTVNSSISFDATITSLFSPLLVGLIVVLLPEKGEIEALKAALCSGTKFSLVKITPAHLKILSHLFASEQVNIQTQAFIIGGEALSEKVTSFWQKHAPATRLINEYGPTETVVGCCIYEVGKQSLRGGDIPIGRPISNTQIYILDSHLQPVPIGVAGELYIGGDGLARGYLNRPELTQEKFIPNPFNDSKFKSDALSLSKGQNSKLYKTGDLARYLPDAKIEFLGRIDQQVKVRGFRIELGEIEAVLNTHPQIQQAVVIATEDIPDKNGLVAYFVSSDESLTTNQIREFLKQKLPEYMVPNAFVTLDTLPLTPNGKIDRKALPAPDGEITRSTEAYVKPQTELERMIATVWQNVLQVEEVGLYDNFFDLGGHSLLLIKVHSQLREIFNQDVSILEMFKYPTVSSFAQYLNQEKSNHLSSFDKSNNQLEDMKEGRNRLKQRLVRSSVVNQEK